MPKIIDWDDIVGKKVGKWEIIQYVGRDKDEDGNFSGRYKYLCRCECGTERKIPRDTLVGERADNCGCVRRLAAYPEDGKKVCSKCQQTKETSSFYKQGNKFASWCKECHGSDMKNRRDTDEEFRKKCVEKCKEYYRKNREQLRKQKREWAAENKDRNRYRRIEIGFGLSQEQFDAVFEHQGKCCGICKSETYGKSRNRLSWHIDHDHSTGVVRGILCSRCNPMLGLGRDSIDILRKAIEYLELPPTQQCGITAIAPANGKKKRQAIWPAVSWCCQVFDYDS